MNTQKDTIEVSALSVTLLRIMVSLIFIVASSNHLLHTDKAVSRIEHASMGFIWHILGTPETAVILSGIAMLIAGIALLIGYKTRLAAIILIAILIPITLTIQVGQMATLGPLFKNVSILGGLLFFTINSNIKIQRQWNTIK